MNDHAGYLYGIVDAAQDERIYSLVQQCPRRKCLFWGHLESEVYAASPWLILLDQSSELFKEWREYGWHRNWGILFRSHYSLNSIEPIFRYRTVAMLPDGDIVVFRYYDPRVFRNFLPLCTIEELTDWFSGIVSFSVPDLGGRGTVQYRLENESLVVESS